MVFDAVGNPQTILLLGGTSEIGLAICERYLRDRAGPRRAGRAAGRSRPRRRGRRRCALQVPSRSKVIDFDAVEEPHDASGR